MTTGGPCRLGIDIGGTKTAALVIDASGTTVALVEAPSGHGPQDVVRVAAELATEALATLDESHRSEITTAGACMPGLVDPMTGTVRHAVNLGVESVSLASELAEQLGLAVTIENDVKAAALGATTLVHGQFGTLGYLNLGTGLAAAIISDGRIVRGVDGSAGEIGHLPLGGDAPCRCGQVGCLETIASGSALARLWPSAASTTSHARDPFAAAAAGDELAAAAAEQLCRGVALAIQVLVLAAGAEHVVIGGGLAALGRPLEDGIAVALHTAAASASMIRALDLPRRFALLPSDVPLAALGAAHLGAIATGQEPSAQRPLHLEGVTP